MSKLKYKILQIKRDSRSIWNRWYKYFESREDMIKHCQELDDDKFLYIGELCSMGLIDP